MFAVKKNKPFDFSSLVLNRADSSPEVRAAINTESPGISVRKRSDIQEGFSFTALA